MKIIEYRAIANAGALVGAAIVELDSGLLLRECKLFRKGDRYWVDAGSRQLTKDGQPITNHSGKIQYSQMVAFRDRAIADKFCEQLLRLIRAEHPGALGSEP